MEFQCKKDEARSKETVVRLAVKEVQTGKDAPKGMNRPSGSGSGIFEV